LGVASLPTVVLVVGLAYSSPKRERRLPVLLMVVEEWKDQNAKAIYRRLREQGRQTPEGLEYVGSPKSLCEKLNPAPIGGPLG